MHAHMTVYTVGMVIYRRQRLFRICSVKLALVAQSMTSFVERQEISTQQSHKNAFDLCQCTGT